MKRAPVIRIQLKSWLVPVLIGALLVLHYFMPHRGWWILFVGIAGLWLSSYIWTWILSQELYLEREMQSGWAHTGATLVDRFTISNSSRLPALWLEVVDHSTAPFHQAGLATRLDSESTSRWEKQSECLHRGLFSIGPTSLRIGDPFGLYVANLNFRDSTTFTVLPPIVSLPFIRMAPEGPIVTGEGRSHSNTLESTNSASGVREYQPGDSLRWIHWPTSARRGKLFVRSFDNIIPSTNWWVLLDAYGAVQAGEGLDGTDEHGVILAASLADKGLRSRYKLGFAAHGERLAWLPPGEGEEQRLEILRALAQVSRGQRPLTELFGRIRSKASAGTGLIIITPDTSGNWIDGLVPLMEQGVIPTVLLLDPASFGEEDRDSSYVESLMTKLGIAYYVVSQDFLQRLEATPQRKKASWMRPGDPQKPLPKPQTGTVWRALS